MTLLLVLALFPSLICIVTIYVVALRLSRRIDRLEETASEPRGCAHPEVENVGTFGLPEYVCVICRARVA
jgi:hypothetical protein